jgi:hypothetical protein
MSRSSRFSRSGSIVAMVLVGCLGLVACGGGGSDKVSASAGGTTTTTKAASDSSDDTSTGSGTTGTGIPDTAACQAAFASLAKASSSAFTGGTDLSAGVKELNALAAAAPKEIKADLTTVVGVLSDMAKALKDAGYDPTKTPTAADSAKFGTAIAALGPKLSDPAYTAAAQRVNDWFDAGCKSS